MVLLTLGTGCRTADSLVGRNNEPLFNSRGSSLSSGANASRPTARQSTVTKPADKVIQLASFQDADRQPDETIEAPAPPATANDAEVKNDPAIDQADELPNDSTPGQTAEPKAVSSQIELADVLQSVSDCYPLIQVAIGEIEAAEGKILSSWGEFDTAFVAYSISQPLSFYKNYRNGIGAAQPLFGGGNVYGEYRIGRGEFEPWYGERETNDGGEFKSGFSLPLLKDRLIDQRRAALYASGFARDEVESSVQARLLLFQRFASQAYWECVAASQVVDTQEKLLELSQVRVGQIGKRVQIGDLPRIAEIDNDRFIASRKNSLIKAQRTFQKTAIKLSLFYRDANCSPLIPDKDYFPDTFPESDSLDESTIGQGILQAVSTRPELGEIDALRKQICIDRNYAQNLTLPKLDVKGFASQDVGAAASSKRDKSPFELQVGVFADVPIQRREGRGKIRTADAKLMQLDAKRKFAVEKITAEVQDAASALNTAHDRIQQSLLNYELNLQSLKLAELSFEQGDIDLIELNIYETAIADARLQLIAAELDYVFFQAVYETATNNAGF